MRATFWPMKNSFLYHWISWFHLPEADVSGKVAVWFSPALYQKLGVCIKPLGTCKVLVPKNTVRFVNDDSYYARSRSSSALIWALRVGFSSWGLCWSLGCWNNLYGEVYRRSFGGFIHAFYMTGIRTICRKYWIYLGSNLSLAILSTLVVSLQKKVSLPLPPCQWPIPEVFYSLGLLLLLLTLILWLHRFWDLSKGSQNLLRAYILPILILIALVLELLNFERSLKPLFKLPLPTGWWRQLYWKCFRLCYSTWIQVGWLSVGCYWGY